jgi:hypothetical protein
MILIILIPRLYPWIAISARQIDMLYLKNLLHIHTYIHPYYSRFIPEGVAEASQIFIRDAHVLPKLLKLLGYEEYADVTVDKSIAV